LVLDNGDENLALDLESELLTENTHTTDTGLDASITEVLNRSKSPTEILKELDLQDKSTQEILQDTDLSQTQEGLRNAERQIENMINELDLDRPQQNERRNSWGSDCTDLLLQEADKEVSLNTNGIIVEEPLEEIDGTCAIVNYTHIYNADFHMLYYCMCN